MIENTANYSNNPLAGLEKELTPKLRQSAMGSGWPSRLAESLEVVIKDLKITVSYPENYAQEIEDLEYGNKEFNPTPVLRTFMSKNNDILAEQLGNWSLDRISESELFQ